MGGERRGKGKGEEEGKEKKQRGNRWRGCSKGRVIAERIERVQLHLLREGGVIARERDLN